MVSRANGETFLGLVLLSVILLYQEGQLTGFRRPQLQTSNSWLAATGYSAEKCQGNLKTLSKIDRTDCQVRPVQALCQANALPITDDEGVPTNELWPIAYPCAGRAYDQLEAKLRNFRLSKVEEHGESWGRRAFGIPAHSRVLFLGNIHIQQMGTSLACQQDGNIASFQVLNREKGTVQVDFTNNSTIVMVNDGQLVIDDDWLEVLGADMAGLWQLNDFDAIILGLFNDCQIALKSHSYECESMTSIMLRQLVDIYLRGPVLFVSEMAATRSDESNTARDLIRYYRDTLKRKNMWFINGRRYISKVGLEGAAPYMSYEEATEVVFADDPNAEPTNYTMKDALNAGVESRGMPRCQGEYGGHSDLLAWDITEFLYSQLVW